MRLAADVRARHPQLVLSLYGVVLVGLVPIAVAVHGRWDADYWFVAVVLLQGGVYVSVATRIGHIAESRAVFAIVVVVAVLLRLPLLFQDPLHSTDVNRYVWDGRVQAAAINPYRFVPADPALVPLRDDVIYPKINRADYAVTIYPPAAQMAFRIFNLIGSTVWVVKLGWLVLEATAMGVLVHLLKLIGRPSSLLLLYAWHPLPVWEIACEGHVDAGMSAFLVFALAAWGGRRRLIAGVLLAASVLFKPLTLVAAPAFWKPWDWRVPVAFIGAAVLAYLPFLDVGAGAVGFLPRYFGEEGIRSGSGFILLDVLSRIVGPLPAAAAVVYLAFGGTLMAGLAIAFVRDRRRNVAVAAMQAQLLLFVFLIVLSPNYPWYFLVLVPLGCLSPFLPARLLTLLSVILYAAGPVDGDPRTVVVQSILYGTVMIAVGWEMYTSLRRRRQGAAPIMKPGTEA